MALDPDVVVVAPMELITADHLNDIRANLVRLDTEFDTGYTTWTPTVMNVTKGSGHTETALYVQHGKIVYCIYNLLLGTGSAVTGDIQVSLPVTAAHVIASSGLLVDFGTSYSVAVPLLAGGSVASLRPINVSGSYGHVTTTTSTNIPHTWADGDSINFGLTYMAA